MYNTNFEGIPFILRNPMTENPLHSPDFNPIDHLWYILDQKARKEHFYKK